ncbi:MAG: serine hydrolase [Microbacterium arborescens]
MTRAQTVRDALVERIAVTGFGARGLHVLAGDDVAEHRWTPDVRGDIHSVAKGVCVLAAAMAADEGLIAFDVPVSAYLDDVPLGPGSSEVTLRHLLTMSSGIDLPWSETMMDDWPDLAREFLGRPSRGRVFQYSNASTYTAMRALAAVVGDVSAFLEPRLFAPLGIHEPRWDRCPLGFVLAGSGLHLRTDEMARLGRLLRDRGYWDGRRLVSPEWIDAMHTDLVPTGSPAPYDGYGLAGWAGPGAAWRLHGAYGQLVILCGDTVVTITADDHGGADAIAADAADLAARP